MKFHDRDNEISKHSRLNNKAYSATPFTMLMGCKRHAILLVALLFLHAMPADAQFWENLKEKAQDAWESDTRKEMWEKTKEKGKEAWNSDTRKKAWKKTKEVSSKALDSQSYTVPITERKFINVIPDSKLNSMGAERYRAFMRTASRSADSKKTAQVNRVARRLATAVERLYAERGLKCDFQWEFNLVRNKDVNAWCMPGGKIVVYEGIMPVANDDASLAIVLGHEIAHAVAKHSAEQMTKSIIAAAGMTAVYMMVSHSSMSERKKMLTKLIASAGVSLATLKFSRVDETEADRLGLIIAAKAGYNPDVAVGLWQRMGKATGNRGKRDWYSTHPSNQNRIANIRSFLPEARRYRSLTP